MSSLTSAVNEDEIIFLEKISEPNSDLYDAIQEGEDILNGKIKAEDYNSVKELIDNLNNDILVNKDKL